MLFTFTQRSLHTHSPTLSTNLLYPLNRLYRPSNHNPILSCYSLISLLTLSTHIHASLSKSSHPTFSIPSHLFLFPLTQLFTPFSYYWLALISHLSLLTFMLPSSNSLATLAHLTLSPFSHLTNTTLSLFSLSLSFSLSYFTLSSYICTSLDHPTLLHHPILSTPRLFPLTLQSLTHITRSPTLSSHFLTSPHFLIPLSHITFSPQPTFSSHSLITLFLPHFFIPSVTPLYYTTLSTYYLITLYHPILLPPLSTTLLPHLCLLSQLILSSLCSPYSLNLLSLNTLNPSFILLSHPTFSPQHLTPLSLFSLIPSHTNLSYPSISYHFSHQSLTQLSYPPLFNPSLAKLSYPLFLHFFTPSHLTR